MFKIKLFDYQPKRIYKVIVKVEFGLWRRRSDLN